MREIRAAGTVTGFVALLRCAWALRSWYFRLCSLGSCCRSVRTCTKLVLSGNVADTHVLCCQLHGWYERTVFDALRCARIPQGWRGIIACHAFLLDLF